VRLLACLPACLLATRPWAASLTPLHQWPCVQVAHPLSCRRKCSRTCSVLCAWPRSKTKAWWVGGPYARVCSALLHQNRGERAHGHSARRTQLRP